MIFFLVWADISKIIKNTQNKSEDVVRWCRWMSLKELWDKGWHYCEVRWPFKRHICPNAMSLWGTMGSWVLPVLSLHGFPKLWATFTKGLRVMEPRHLGLNSPERWATVNLFSLWVNCLGIVAGSPLRHQSGKKIWLRYKSVKVECALGNNGNLEECNAGGEHREETLRKDEERQSWVEEVNAHRCWHHWQLVCLHLL